jgi:hypothetical protein
MANRMRNAVWAILAAWLVVLMLVPLPSAAPVGAQAQATPTAISDPLLDAEMKRGPARAVPAAISLLPHLPGQPLPSSGYSIDEYEFVKDYAGNRFDGYLLTEGNTTTIKVIKRNPQGVVLAQEQAQARNPQGAVLKLNSMDMAIDVADLVIVGNGYELTSPSRNHWQVGGVWANIAVPFPNGTDPAAGTGLQVFAGVTQPEPSSCDAECIRAIVKEEIKAAIGLSAGQTLKQEITGSITGNFRQALEDKAKDALREERVLTEQMFNGGAGSFIVYQQLLNTSYTGALEARKQPLPTPTVGP